MCVTGSWLRVCHGIEWNTHIYDIKGPRCVQFSHLIIMIRRVMVCSVNIFKPGNLQVCFEKNVSLMLSNYLSIKSTQTTIDISVLSAFILKEFRYICMNKRWIAVIILGKWSWILLQKVGPTLHWKDDFPFVISTLWYLFP